MTTQNTFTAPSSVLEWYILGEFRGHVEQGSNPHVIYHLSLSYICPICTEQWAKAARLRQDNTYAPFTFLAVCCPDHRLSEYQVPGVLTSGGLDLDHLSPGAVEYEFNAWLREFMRNAKDENDPSTGV